ncbi:MAG: trypsin-like peptidase domain-containing protein [Acidimicrobiales bacterium]|nr:trypsin-like peptidase domain-containing protein [Acidimicrobiales bacterium]
MEPHFPTSFPASSNGTATIDLDAVDRVPPPAHEPPVAPAPPSDGAPVRRAHLVGVFVASVLASAVVAFVMGWAVGRGSQVTVEQAPATESATELATEAADGAVSDSAAGVTPTSATTPSADVEPIAAAAAVIAPSVVQLETSSGLGSGVVYDDGLVLTAAHVVEGARSVTVRFSDGSTVEGEVVGTHSATDIAVVRLPEGTPAVVATLAPGDALQVGQTVVAVGSPFGLDQSVTSGIISAVDRTVDGIPTVQTDAAINPGNSGGPLVDLEGRVVGINDSIYSQSGGNEGVGFAIPSDLAAIVADQLAAGEPVRLAQLGVSTLAPTDGSGGALVGEVVAGSAAEQSGIEVGDVITAIDGVAVADGGRLRSQVLTRQPGDEVQLTVQRGGEELTIDATLGSTAG